MARPIIKPVFFLPLVLAVASVLVVFALEFVAKSAIVGAASAAGVLSAVAFSADASTAGAPALALCSAAGAIVSFSTGCTGASVTSAPIFMTGSLPAAFSIASISADKASLIGASSFGASSLLGASVFICMSAAFAPKSISGVVCSGFSTLSFFSGSLFSFIFSSLKACSLLKGKPSASRSPVPIAPGKISFFSSTSDSCNCDSR